VKAYPALADVSPLKADRLVGVDMVVLRELTAACILARSGAKPLTAASRPLTLLIYNEDEIRRIVHFCLPAGAHPPEARDLGGQSQYHRDRRLWRRVATQVAAEYPDITCEHVLVDTAAMRLIARPPSFDVVVTENTLATS